MCRQFNPTAGQCLQFFRSELGNTFSVKQIGKQGVMQITTSPRISARDCKFFFIMVSVQVNNKFLHLRFVFNRDKFEAVVFRQGLVMIGDKP